MNTPNHTFQKMNLRFQIIFSFILFSVITFSKNNFVIAEEIPGSVKTLERVLLGEERLFLEEVPGASAISYWPKTGPTFVTLDSFQSMKSLSIWKKVNPDGTERFFVKLTGEFAEPKNSLIVNGWVAVKGNSDLKDKARQGAKSFLQFVEIFESNTTLEWISLDEQGNTKTLMTTLEVEAWDQLNAKVSIHPVGVNFWTAGLGASYLSYQETRVADLTLISAQARLGYSRQWARRWDFAAQATSTLFHFYKSSHKDKSIHLITANVRTGYLLPFVKYPNQLSLMGGFAYQRLFVSNHAFGFKNLLYPQIYPTFSRFFSNRGLGYAYLRYVPLSKSFKINFREREIGMGSGYQFPSNSTGSYWSVGFDYSSTKVMPVKGYHLEAKAYTLSLSKRL